MKNYFTFRLIVLSFSLFLAFQLNAQYNVDFEDGTKGAYAADTVLLNGKNWIFTDAVIGTLSNDRKNGLKSARVRNTGTLEMIDNKTTGAGSIIVYHAKYGSDANSTWKLETSVDDGMTWIQQGSDVTTNSTTLTLATFSGINITGNVRVRIVKLTGGSARINFDDFSVSDYPTTVADRLVISGAPTQIAVNTPFVLNICAQDSAGNTQVDYSTPIALTQFLGSSATISPPSPQNPVSGCVTYTVTPVVSNELINFEASSGSLTPDSTGDIQVHDSAQTCYSDASCDFGIYMVQTNTDNDVWTCSNSLYSINGFCGGCGISTEGWLVSPEFATQSTYYRSLNFDLTQSFTGPDLEVLYTIAFSGDPSTTSWTSLGTVNGTGSKLIDVTAINSTSLWFAFKYTADGATGGSASYQVSQIEIQSDDCSKMQIKSCVIDDLTQANTGNCDNKGTTNVLDDTYQGDVTVHFSNFPGTGYLRIYVDNVLKDSVDVSTFGSNDTTYTFTSFVMPSNNAAFNVKADFSANSSCNYTEQFPARESCSPAYKIVFNPSLATTYYQGDTTVITFCFTDENNIPSPQGSYPNMNIDISPALGMVLSGPDGTGPCFTYTILPVDTGAVTVTVYDDNLIFFASANTRFVTKPCVFISEVVDPTSGNNKYLEIYNGGDQPVDISGFKLLIYSNGNTSPNYTLPVHAGTVLQPTRTYVFRNTLAGQDFTACDTFVTVDNNMNTNGDDAFELTDGSEVMDAYGVVGEQPGPGVSWNYQDKVVTRNPDIYCGHPGFILSEWAKANYTTNNTGTPCNHCVNPLAWADADTLCAGDVIQLNAKGGNTYAWSGPNGFASSVQNPEISNSSSASTGWYVLTVTTLNTCTDITDSVYIVVFDSTQPIAGATPNPIYPGQTLNLSVTPGTAYSWTGPGGFSSSLQNPVINNVQESNEGDYIVAVTTPCGTLYDTVAVEVLPLFDPNADANPNPVCEGADVQLSASGGGLSYAWSGPNGFSSGDQNPVLNDVVPSDSGYYKVNVEISTGVFVEDSVFLIVNPTPIVDIGLDTLTACLGNDRYVYVYTEPSGGTYLWTGPNGDMGTNDYLEIDTFSVNDVGTYYVTYTSPAGCVASDSIYLQAYPTSFEDILAITPNPVCEGDSLFLISIYPDSFYLEFIAPNGDAFYDNDTIFNVPNIYNGLWTVNVYNQRECPIVDYINVIIAPLPDVTALANPNPICIGDTLHLDAATMDTSCTFMWTGPNGFSSNEQQPEVPIIDVNQAGQYQVIITNSGGCTDTSSVTVTIYPLPTVLAAASPNPVCEGDTLYLSAYGSGSFSWTGPNGFTSNQQYPVIPDVSLSATGDYIVILTNTAGCTNSDTVAVTVNPKPVTIASASPNPICAGSTLNLSATGSGTFAWTGPNGFSSNQQNPVINNVSTSDAGDYIVTLTNSDGCQGVDTVSVVVNPTPITIASATPNPVCTGATLNLNASGNGSFAWAGPNGFSSNQQNPVVNNISLANAGNYIVTLTNPEGCIGKDTVTVIVNPAPIVNATATPNPICVGSTLSLSTTGSGTFAWTGPNGFSSNQQNPQIPNITLAYDGDYIVVVTSNQGCISRDTVHVDVYQLPNVTVSATPNPVCQGEKVQFNATGNGTYAWSGPLNFHSTLKDPVRRLNDIGMSGIYTVTVTSPEGCTATGSVSIQVLPAVNGEASANASAICFGSELDLFASGGVTYHWTGPNGFDTNIQNPVVSDFQFKNIGKYIVEITNASGCSKLDTVDIKGLYPPQATASYEQSTACVGSDLQLYGSGRGQYLWTGPNGFTSTDRNPVIHNVTQSNSGIYKLVVTGINGCSDAVLLSVEVHNLPDINVISGPIVVCEGGDVQLKAEGDGSISWSGPYGFKSYINDPLITNIPLYMQGYYVATCVGKTGCVSKDSVLVQVTKSIEVTAYADQPVVCQEGRLRLFASGGETYYWTGPGGFHSNDQNPVIDNVQPEDAGTYQVLVYNHGGCFGTAYVEVEVTPLDYEPYVYASPNPVLEGGQVTFFASEADEYKWSGPLGFSSNLKNPQIADINRDQAGLYQVILSDPSGCPVIRKVVLRVLYYSECCCYDPNCISTGNIPCPDFGIGTGGGNISPNPASTELILSGALSRNASYSIFASSGTLVKSGVSTNARVDIRSLDNGSYYIIWSLEGFSEIYRNPFIKIQ